MKIFSAAQIKAIDQYTIQHEPITSVQLMERAAKAFTCQIETEIKSLKTPICIICGNGNNGGDGLAIARLLLDKSRPVSVYIFPGDKKSPEFIKNLKRLQSKYRRVIHTLKSTTTIEKIPHNAVIIDCIFGIGLTEALKKETLFHEIIESINNRFKNIIAVDIPSGLLADKPTHGIAILAHKTYTFQFPKLAFLLPENSNFIVDFLILDIGLHPGAIDKTITSYTFTTEEEISRIIIPRKKFSHKGTFGHALLVAGSLGKTGAAVLSATACLRSGAGLVTTHIPTSSYSILQSSISEVMCNLDKDKNFISEIPPTDKYNAIGIGPGIGTNKKTIQAFEQLLTNYKKPLVIDADGINILAKKKKLLELLPPKSILTPHPGEFERLVGKWKDDFERLELQRALSKKYNIIIVLKGAHTSITNSDGNTYFNSTGNPGMATAGTGDILTGIITGLLAQRYTPLNSAILGVYLHGLAADIALKIQSEESLIASDILLHIGSAFKNMLHKEQI